MDHSSTSEQFLGNSPKQYTSSDFDMSNRKDASESATLVCGLLPLALPITRSILEILCRIVSPAVVTRRDGRGAEAVR
jgi:hypothetical protein